MAGVGNWEHPLLTDIVPLQKMKTLLGVGEFPLMLATAKLAFDLGGQQAFDQQNRSDFCFSNYELEIELSVASPDLRRWLSPLVSTRSLAMTLDHGRLESDLYADLPAAVRTFLDHKGIFLRDSEKLYKCPDIVGKLILSETDMLEMTYLTVDQLRSLPRFIRPSRDPKVQSLWIQAFPENWYRYEPVMDRFHVSFKDRNPLFRKKEYRGRPKYLLWNEII